MQKDSDLTELVMNNVLGQWVLYTPRAYYVLSPTERSQRLWLSQLTKTTQLKFLWWLFEKKKGLQAESLWPPPSLQTASTWKNGKGTNREEVSEKMGR